MIRSLRSLVSAVALLSPMMATADDGIATAGWKVFRQGGMEARYPSQWVRWDEAGNELFLTSTHERQEAVIIVHGEAMISLGELTPPVPGKPRTAYREGKDVDQVLSDTVIPHRTEDPDACGDVERLATVNEVGPNAFEVSVIYLCTIKGRSFQTVLSYWREPGPRPEWEGTALEIMRSLRLP
ncbi:hypothetical protein [Nitrospirillum sp. BR 11828]|uniref:hypothetical protein n=1 Tax=Nitrospirillum sp. BR 11828 TaxID=3104325 RepID=UPI002ACA5B66|nr:hypothetical protein [Nitrospirillum sp. BR 11828]MDZ5646948.1 hypothetical protein [Nitrospirillum sp. BR 11828]